MTHLSTIPVDKLLYTPEQAALALEMGLDAVEDWMAKGRLKYSVERERGKRRIYRDDLIAFARWHSEEFRACPSISTKTPPSGNSTSNVVDVDFADRSTVSKDGRKSPAIGRSGKPKGRKRSLGLGSPPPGPSARG